MANPIVINKECFQEEFLPEKLIAREGIIRQIAEGLNSNTFTNLHVHGEPGTGKTSVIKWILKEHFPDRAIYVNCWNKRTGHKIFEDILLQSGFPVHGKEARSDLFRKFQSRNKKIICLDEVERIKETDILYDLAQHCESLVLISNSKHGLTRLDQRISERMPREELEFKHYSHDDMLEILKERASYGLRIGSINKEVLSMISKVCSGNARVGLQTLAIAARRAENKGRETVTAEELRHAIKCTRKRAISYVLEKTNLDQRTLYEIIKEHRIIESGKLYGEYLKQTDNPVKETSYRKYMKQLVDLELVKEQGSVRWRKYKII